MIKRPRGAARSARHPVKVEVVGSNPIEGAGWIKVECVGWAWARPGGCNPPASEHCRFNSCPTHSPRSDPPGPLPGPALSPRRPGRQTGKAASLRGWCVWVRLPPRPPTADRPVVQRPGRLSYKQDIAGSNPAGTTPPRSAGIAGGPRLDDPHGLLVQQQDACLASRRSGCDSPAVHSHVRKVAGYGWPGPVANGCARKGVRVRIPRLPLDRREPRKGYPKPATGPAREAGER